MDIDDGDVLTLKKPHPCKGNNFLVTRIGVDFKVKCLSCSHEIFIPREKIEKMTKKVDK